MYSRADPRGDSPAASRGVHSGSSRRRAWLWRGLQLIATLAAFGYVFSLVSPSALLAALSRVSPLRFGAAMLLTVVALGFGAVRWSMLFVAFGAPHPPPFARVCRYYVVGFFYNSCVPGGVGGDLVRALASRHAWGPERAATAGIATVLVERLLGLSGLLGLVSLVAIVHPLPFLGSAWLPGALGLCGAALPLIALSLAPRLSQHLSPRLSRLVARLPVPQRILPLMAAAGISLATQLVPALAGHAIVSSLDSRAALLDSLSIVPLAAASAFLPITVSGAGVREAIFVKLYEAVGVATETALAASLLLWCSQMGVALLGGLYTLARPLDAER